MAFIVEFSSGEKTEFDDRARYTLDDSGVLHITTPDERLVFAPHTWAKLVEKHDPRQPSTRFV
jgi:hypothetical protein